MLTVKHSPAHLFKSASLTLAAACVFSSSVAGPSQSPLINRPESRPRPNFVLTLDDSGSMNYQYMPERRFTVTNGSVKENVDFPTDGKVYMHPEEVPARIFSSNRDKSDVHFVAADTISNTADVWTILHQTQMRSPQLNSIYYNPAIKYKPWIDAQGRSFGEADPENAYFDPLALAPGAASQATAKKIDLTKIKYYENVRWYCSPAAGAPNYTPCTTSSKSFNPAIFYLLVPGQSPNSSLPSSYTLYNLNDTAKSQLVFPGKYEQRKDECTLTETSTTCARAQELRNFANWFVFYRSRLLVAQGAIPAAFSDLKDSLRLGWGTIHSGNFNADPETNTTQRNSIVQQGVRNLTTEHKSKFFDWLRDRPTFSLTPTRSALIGVGDYFQRTDINGPWRTNPESNSASSNLTCRRSYNILVTDGYYNDNAPNVGNVDGNELAPNYTPIYPFQDKRADTLADIALKYWATDLQPDMLNDVRPTSNTDSIYKNDPATWQHLTQFTVGLGVTGTMPTTVAQLDSLANCGKGDGTCWTDNLIDDLWHAAVNSRGEYFSATDVDSLTTSFMSALQLGSGALQKEAGVATASPTLIADNVKFVPEYTPVDWTGTIKAYSLDIKGVAGAELWDAATRLPSPGARQIYTWDAGRTGAQVVPFTATGYEALSKAYKDQMGKQGSASLIDYIRGNDNPSDGVLRRKRKGRLPDFVNSAPLYVKQGFDLGYTNSSSAGAALYKDYRDKKVARGSGALFIGGNGGMLHVFSDGGSTQNGGVEQFAFVPYGGVGNLYKLAQRDYGSTANSHQFFVDGPLSESDAYITVNGKKEWANIVVGTMGAGGRSVFAMRLNTLNPSQLNESSVLWEVNGPSGDAPTGTSKDDIGYITSEAQVGMLPNGEWKVFVGNGLHSQSGRSALLVIDLQSGEVDSIWAGNPSANGLGGVRLVRNSTTREVISVYAGDATGKLWRFDYDKDTGRMRTGFKGNPLFNAVGPDGGTQAIMAAPLVTVHPSGGRLVVFGTGRLMDDADSASTQTQTLYGIWDEVKALDTSFAADPPSLGAAFLRSADALLVNQEITGSTTVTQVDANGDPLPKLDGNGKPIVDGAGRPVYQTNTFYELTAKPVDWSTKKGWLLDMNLPSSAGIQRPRVIDAPLGFGGSVYFSSLVPAPGGGETCAPPNNGTGYAFLLKILNGGQQSVPSFDTNGSLTINGDDRAAAGMSTEAGRRSIVTDPNPLDFETGAGPTKKKYDCNAGSSQGAYGAVGIMDCTERDSGDPKSLEVKDRIWRQLLNPPSP